MQGDLKIVDFQYCKLCEHENVDESESPCWECLNEPVNVDSRRPIMFKEKTKKELVK